MDSSFQKIERAIARGLEDAKVEHLRLSLLTVVAAGIVYGGAVLAAFLAPLDEPRFQENRFLLLHMVNAVSGVLILMAVFNVGRSGKYLWGGAALATFILLVGISYAISLLTEGNRILVVVYFTFGMIVLGLLGQMMKRDDGTYQFAVGGRRHSGSHHEENQLRLALFLPVALLDCIGEVFGGSWLRKGLTSEEIAAAAGLLTAIDTPEAEQMIRSLDPARARILLRALTRLELIAVREGAVRRTPEGENIVRGWH